MPQLLHHQLQRVEIHQAKITILFLFSGKHTKSLFVHEECNIKIVFFDFTKEGTLESDEDNKDVINLKRKLKTTRESFQFAKDSGNEKRELKKKKLVEDMEDELEKRHDEHYCELIMMFLPFLLLFCKCIFAVI